MQNKLIITSFGLLIMLLSYFQHITILKFQEQLDMLHKELDLLKKQSLRVHESFSPYKLSPPALNSIRLSEEEELIAAKKRKSYGGKYDPLHLGGFTESDNQGISHNLWNFMLGPLAVKSVLDVGCGKGVSTAYFLNRGAKVLCIEGSHDAVTQSLLPLDVIIEHDFTLGPWWPESTFDVAWSVEFLEHVGRPYMKNYLPAFKKCALLFVTTSMFGGWHHVEVHEEWWWIGRFAAQGFIFSPELTELSRTQANNTANRAKFEAQHLRYRLLVFINPSVASLPQHSHLFGGHGCHNLVNDNRDGGKPCSDKGDILPLQFQSLMDCNRKININNIPPSERAAAWKEAAWSCQPNPMLKNEGK